MITAKDGQEVLVSQLHLPEAEIQARIVRLELEAKDVRRRVEHARTIADRRVLNKQLEEIKNDLEFLRECIP